MRRVDILQRAARVLGALACSVSQAHGAQNSAPRRCCARRDLANMLVLRARAGQTAITDATIWTAVEECQAESAAFDCPASQATYGPIEDWDVGAVTSLNNFGNGCTETWNGDVYEPFCGCASPVCFDLSDLRF